MKYDDYQAAYPDFIVEVLEAKVQSQRLRSRLKAAGCRDTRRLLMRRVLTEDFPTRLHFAFEGVRRAGRLSEYDPAAIHRMARELNVYAPLNEPVEARVVRRGTKDRRVYSFRPRSRARQLLAAAVIRAIYPPLPNQFTIVGGVPKALCAVEKGVREGHHFVRELDIQAFYPSVRLEHLLMSLRPLPRAVVENTIWMGDAAPLVSSDGFLHGVDGEGLLPVRGLRGLPQGSACSPIAAEKLVANIVTSLPPGSRAVTYADNIMLLGETQNDVERATATLVSRLEALPAGPLTLKAPFGQIYDARLEAVRFLGHEGELVSGQNGSTKIEWQPDYFAFERLTTVIENRAASKMELRREIKRVQHWQRAYSLWKDGPEYRSRALAELKAKLAYISPSIERHVLAGEVARHWFDLSDHPSLEELLPETIADHANRREGFRQLVDARRLKLMHRHAASALLARRSQPH